MGNFFSSDEFLCTYGETLSTSGGIQIKTVQVEDVPFRILKIGRKDYLQIPFQDFIEPLTNVSFVPPKIPFLPKVSLLKVSASDWPQHKQPGLIPSPLIDWTKYTTWDEYVTWAQGLNKKAFSKNTQYKFRRLERELGTVTFDFSSSDASILELCFDWKSAQYQESGVVGLTKNSIHRRFFKKMFDQGILTMAVMKAADVVLAIHIGVVQNGRFYYWIPAYDPQYKRHSAGTILLEKMIEWSYRQNHNEYDFLEGGEAYKFLYATDVRIIQALGKPPVAQRLWKPVRKKLIGQLKKQESAYEFARVMKRKFKKYVQKH